VNAPHLSAPLSVPLHRSRGSGVKACRIAKFLTAFFQDGVAIFQRRIAASIAGVDETFSGGALDEMLVRFRPEAAAKFLTYPVDPAFVDSQLFADLPGMFPMRKAL
jgi:hypothetical protein